jgi:hypothetical protein
MDKKTFVALFSFLLFSTLAFGQFPAPANSFSSRDIGVKINNSRDMAGLLNRLQMSHSFGVSMSSSAFGSAGVMSYQNNFFLPVSEKLNLKGTLYLMQPAFASNPLIQNSLGSSPSVYYDTELNYKVGEKSNISIGISNLPYYPAYQYYGGAARGISPVWMAQ